MIYLDNEILGIDEMTYIYLRYRNDIRNIESTVTGSNRIVHL